MEETVSWPDQDVQLNHQRRLVITVHGIRTFGQWQERLESLVKSREPTIDFDNYHFGYYSILAYIFPPLRWLMTLRFRRALIKAAERAQWDRIDIVAHSFGTHLAAWGLYGIPSKKRPKIHTIIFAASVLKTNFPWSELIGTCVKRLVNDCGDRDNVLLFNQLAVLFTGRAGQVGFNGMTNDQFRNRFFNFGHSGYFMKEGKIYDDFMRDKWLPLLIRDEPIELFDERTPPSAIRGFLIFLANNATPIKLSAYVIIFAIPAIVYYRLFVIAEEQRQIAEQQRIEAMQRKSEAEKATREANEARLVAIDAKQLAEKRRQKADERRMQAEHQRNLVIGLIHRTLSEYTGAEDEARKKIGFIIEMFNQANTFEFDGFEFDEFTESILKLLGETLASTGFKGKVLIEGRVGTFCVIYEDKKREEFRLAPDDMPIGKCQFFPPTNEYKLVLGEKRAARLRRLMEPFESPSLKFLILVYSRERLIPNPYPHTGSAKEWNKVAKSYDTLVISLIQP